MAKFQVKYLATELVTTHEQSDCHTVEQFINCRFGTCDTSGIEVTLLEEEPVPTEPVVTEEVPVEDLPTEEAPVSE